VRAVYIRMARRTEILGFGAGSSIVRPTLENSGALTGFVNSLLKMADDVDRGSH
jgi:hypothetical protein